MENKTQFKTKVLLVDDHPILRQGIRTLLERERDFEVVAEAGDGEEAVSLADEFKPDVVVMDISMPKLSGLEATRQIKAKNPGIAVLVLTIYEDEEYFVGLLEAGATGYLLKSAYGDKLIQAIRAVRNGEFVLHPIIGQGLLKSVSSRQLQPIRLDAVEELTGREAQVLRLAARGMSNSEIAIEMDIKVRTVKGHMASIFTKMKVGSRIEAVLSALKRGWVVLEDINSGGG